MSKSLNERFTDLADIISEGMGRWWVTALALLLVILWAATGPFVGYSDSWQLWVNTPTTIAELFIGFLIAAAANRVERRHDVLLETIQQQAEASVKKTERDIAVSHKNEEDLAEIKESLVRLELSINPREKKEEDEAHIHEVMALIQYEEEVIRVCAVYPHKVPTEAMKHALKALGYSPMQVYRRLAMGEILPDLDALLLGPGKEQP